MPVHKVKGGWRWGTKGKVYPTLKQAQRQAAAIYASGYREDQDDLRKQRRAARLLRASARAEKCFERDVLQVVRGVHEGFRRILHAQLDLRAPETRTNALLSARPRSQRERPTEGGGHGPLSVGVARRVDVFRQDAGDESFQKLLARLFVYVQHGVAPAFDRMAKTVDGDNAEALKLFGIDPRHVPGLAGILASARTEAIRRVQGEAQKYATQVQAVLDDPKNADLRVEDLAELLEDRASVSESRAAFIARDTTLRTNANVTRMRQQAAGVDEYRWSTSRDERVRPMHAALEGEKFSYDDPPETTEDGDTNNPGEDYQCRCVALPVISFLEEPAPEEETAA